MEELTEADLVIQNIMNDDEDMDCHISAFELINHFKNYQASLAKFHVTKDELFERLSIKNKELDNF